VINGIFAYWGLSQLMFGLLYVLVLWRYRSLISLMSLFIFFEWTGRLLLGFYKPIETVGTAPGAIGNMIFPVVALIMLVLTLRSGHCPDTEGRLKRSSVSKATIQPIAGVDQAIMSGWEIRLGLRLGVMRECDELIPPGGSAPTVSRKIFHI
jgi:hypothetical protein